MKINSRKITIRSYIADHCRGRRRFKKKFARDKHDLLKSVALTDSLITVSMNWLLIVNIKC